MPHIIGTDTPSDAIVQPIWIYRVLPSLALLALVLAQTLAAHSEPWHDGLVGAATGLLVVLCVVGFSANAILAKDTPQPSDVQNVRVTP